MDTALVGYTGFVGSNIASRRSFDGLYNSKNIQEAFGTRPKLLIYAGVTAAKFIANSAPEKDMEICTNAYDNICKINPERLVLISTVDVYENAFDVDENTPLNNENQLTYGSNRARLEALVHDKFANASIIRLPGLFGGRLKKNFIYDMLTITPAMLKCDKYEELSIQSELVKNAYTQKDNGFYALKALDKIQTKQLRDWFFQNDFNALSFTDCRSQYQFYDLANLNKDIAWALAANLPLVNICTEPISAAKIYKHVTKGASFTNELSLPVAKYNMKSKYSALFGGENGYFYSKDDVLYSISAFMRAMQDII